MATGEIVLHFGWRRTSIVLIRLAALAVHLRLYRAARFLLRTGIALAFGSARVGKGGRRISSFREAWRETDVSIGEEGEQ